MLKAFVTGWPVSHSKSPMLHGYWLEKYGIAGSYEAVGIAPEDFPAFLGDLPGSGFRGGNVTIPHKEVAFEIITDRDDAAEVIGAVNTIWLEDGALRAGNTDAYGFSANLDEFAPAWRNQSRATVLGAGGASRAVIHSLVEAGFSEICIANRTLSRAENLADQFGPTVSAHSLDAAEELFSDTDVLVNTTSLGMSGTEEAQLPDLEKLPAHALVTDIVYTPLETPLLKAASNRGLATVDGLGMLLHQAVPGFEKWFGVRPEVTSGLRNHILGTS